MNSTRLGKESILSTLSANANAIKLFGVKDLGIFGSVARGEDTAESDVDFVVQFEQGKENYDNFINLAYFLEELLDKKVDLLTYEFSRPRLRQNIEKDVINIPL